MVTLNFQILEGSVAKHSGGVEFFMMNTELQCFDTVEWVAGRASGL